MQALIWGLKCLLSMLRCMLRSVKGVNTFPYYQQPQTVSTAFIIVTEITNLLQDKTINFSVPLGSILGPTLFNYYVSTLMEIMLEREENFVSQYAVDHALINSFHPENTEIFSTLASNIACIQDWMDKNQLKMNSSKTEFTVFGSKHQLQTYTLNSLKVDDTVIMAKPVIKFLGT